MITEKRRPLLGLCLISVLNVKALVGALNQKKALVVGTFFMIVQYSRTFF